MSVHGSLSESFVSAQGQAQAPKREEPEGSGRGLQHTMAPHGAHSLTETDGL